jgi:hypothetical protein
VLIVTDDESHPVKRMIRGLGAEMTSTYSQTLNWVRSLACLNEAQTPRIGEVPSGPFLVSRTGDVG